MPHAGHGEPALLAPFALPRHSGRAAPLCSSGGSRALRIDRSDYSPSDDEGAEDSIYIRFNQRDHGRSCGEPVLSADSESQSSDVPTFKLRFSHLGNRHGRHACRSGRLPLLIGQALRCSQRPIGYLHHIDSDLGAGSCVNPGSTEDRLSLPYQLKFAARIALAPRPCPSSVPG